MSTHWPRLALCMALTASLACSVRTDQVPVDSGAIAFVDAASGFPIGQVLILPSTLESVGVATAGGHGPGYMKYRPFLANPFIYNKGNRFEPIQPSSKGILVPYALFAGTGVSLAGCVVLAQGYHAEWLWQLANRRSGEVRLKPLAGSEASANARRWARLLLQSRIQSRELTSEEQFMLSATADSDIGIRFTDEERQAVSRCLAFASR